MSVPEIDVASAQTLLKTKDATFLDVRDPGAFHANRIPGALWLHDGNVADFVKNADKTRPVVIYCYRGNSSQGGASYLLEQGFKQVQSLSGGFDAWSTAKGPAEAGAPGIEAPAGFSVTALAQEKLTQYLSGETTGTRVRVSAENGSWALALDEPTGGDATFEYQGLGFVIPADLAPHLAQLEIGFVEKASQAGFTFEGAEPPGPPGRAELLEDVKTRIRDNKVMLFLKGTADAPRCGFSARTVEALRSTGKPFGDKNVLEAPDYRYVLSEFSEWPTIPQLFINGEFVGGCDIVLELQRTGELQRLVDAAG